MKCPECNKRVDWEDNPSRPFCSERCKLLDFDRWVSEDYRVPGNPLPTEEVGDEAVRDQEVGD
jgi:endogenous inhibitor of DNA gyrase (YacG/DUF329 family)